MCAIAGIFSKNKDARNWHEDLVRANNSMIHRGPDGEGYFFDDTIGLANRRLAIIDLKTGQQPVFNETKDIIAVFNGEIYNYIELRKLLENKGHRFNSQSDTEMLVHLYEEKKEKLLEDLVGMFAFAIYDSRKKTLLVARDHFGIKPLYFTSNSDLFIFASEIKALLLFLNRKHNPDARSLLDYLTFQYIPGERTLFADIFKVLPGEMIIIDKYKNIRKKYWNPEATKQNMSAPEYLNNFYELFKKSVSLQLRSDVPVGYHLSGGVDTAAVVGAAKLLMPKREFLTFSCNVPGEDSLTDEKYANYSSKYFHTIHHIESLNSDNFLHYLKKIMWFMDEPSGDPGIVPQFLTNQVAKQYVKVILTGHGSDETLGGYARHLLIYLDSALKDAIFNTKNCELTISDISDGLPFLKSYKSLTSKFFEGSFISPQVNRYLSLVVRSKNARELLNQKYLHILKDYEPLTEVNTIFNKIIGNGDILDKVLYFDLNVMLPPLLQMEDRAGMANSLESRLPFLDHRLVEFAIQVPTRVKLMNGNLKYLVREGLKKFIPPLINKRKEKTGRPVPLQAWMTQKKFRSEITKLLLSSESAIQTVINRQQIENVLTQNQPFDRTLWGMICLEIWMETFI